MGAWVQGRCRKWKGSSATGTRCRARQGAEKVKEDEAGPGLLGGPVNQGVLFSKARGKSGRAVGTGRDLIRFAF